MRLSMRMKQIIDLVEPCKTVADIGCDHGYVAIDLIEKGLADTVIAMDVRKGPLSRAMEHISQAGLTSRIPCRLSDGLEQLQPGEAETLIMAGMGGLLITGILERGKEKRKRTETLILQPQSDIPEVRRYLHNDGYQIQREEMLEEDGKYYIVIQGKPGRESYDKEIYYQYGKNLLDRHSDILYQYLQKEERLYAEIAEQLKGQRGEGAEKRLQELAQQMEWNWEAQKVYEVKRDY